MDSEKDEGHDLEAGGKEETPEEKAAREAKEKESGKKPGEAA
jgi:hypothetical protein